MRKKIIRVTTADISLDSLLKGQLKYLTQYFEVIGVAKNTGVLKEVSEREGIRVVDAPLERPISLVKDIKGLWFLCRLFRKLGSLVFRIGYIPLQVFVIKVLMAC